jgi:uncharacterized membrane protein
LEVDKSVAFGGDGYTCPVMHLTQLTFMLGMVAGLRSMTAPAVMCWAAHWGWFDLQGTPLAFMASTAATAVFSLLALGELIADKLPATPSRLAPGPLAARIVLGGLSGSAYYAAVHWSLLVGAVVGGIGGVAGAFAGYHVRRAITQKLHVPDFLIAPIEDVIAIGSAFFIARAL